MDVVKESFPQEHELSDGATVRLRLMQPGDVPKLIALFSDLTDEDARVMRDNLADPATIKRLVETNDPERMLIIVAEAGDELWGEATLLRHPGTQIANVGELRMYVSTLHRGRGLGHLMLDQVIELGATLGLEQILSDLYLDNVAMISAFERRGFEREAILPVYQTVVMRYDLLARPRQTTMDVAHGDKLPPRSDWPDLVFDPDLLEIPDTFNLSEMLDRVVARGQGNRAAIHFRNEIITYELLLTEIQKLASSLAHLGLNEGNPVLLHLPNTPQAIAANFAVQRVGGMSVPTIFLLTAAEMDHIVRESGVVAAITTADHLDFIKSVRDRSEGKLRFIVADGLDEHHPDEHIYSYARLVARGARGFPSTARRREEIALLLYTSAEGGGHPVGTAHRLDGLLGALDCFGRYTWRINEDDVICALAPLGFPQNIITCGLMPFRFGASAALPDDPMAFSGIALGQTIRKHRVTVIWGSPTSYRQMLSDDRLDELTLASLRLCSSGGEPLTKETYEAWQQRFAQPIFEGFGTTEMLYGFLSNAVGMAPRVGSLGRVVPGYNVRVVGDQGQDLGVGEIGYLAVRGPTGTIYWNNPHAQRRSLHSGWNRLPDYGYTDTDGYYWFVARRDDLIKSSSFRIDPAEVERALAQHPQVREAAVIGLPDPLRGQRAVAYVVLILPEQATPALGAVLLNSLKATLAEYKVPDEIIFVPTLPRNPQGQLQRQWLRDQARTGGD